MSIHKIIFLQMFNLKKKKNKILLLKLYRKQKGPIFLNLFIFLIQWQVQESLIVLLKYQIHNKFKENSKKVTLIIKIINYFDLNLYLITSTMKSKIIRNNKSRVLFLTKLRINLQFEHLFTTVQTGRNLIKWVGVYLQTELLQLLYFIMLNNFCSKQPECRNICQTNRLSGFDFSCHQRNISQFLCSIDKINQLQNQTQMQNLILLLKNISQICCKSISLTAQSQATLKQSEQSNRAYDQTIKKQYIDLRSRYQKLLTRLLNLRAKMVSQMYMHKASSQQACETDFNFLNESIRHRKMQITNKCNRLRFLKLNEQQRSFQTNHQQPAVFDPLLKQFKRGAELLQKETFKMKLQLDLFIKYAQGENIDTL